MNAKTLIGVTAVAILTTLALADTAAAVTVNGYIKVWDSRANRNGATGSLLNWTLHRHNVAIENVKIYVYDQDGACRDWVVGCFESDDDLLGTYTTNVIGKFTATVGNLDDVYFLFKGEHTKAQLKNATGGQLLAVSSTAWNLTSTTTKTFNLTCPDDTINTTEGYCDDQESVDDNYAILEGFGNILLVFNDMHEDFATDVLYPSGHTGAYDLYYPDSPSGNCTEDGDLGATSRSFGFDSICIGYPHFDQNHIISHELGHTLMRRHLDFSGTLGNCPSTYNWTDGGNERCATSEGWADFIGAVAHWQPSATAPLYRGELVEGDTDAGNGVDRECVRHLWTDRKIAKGNVVRFFWDLYDSTTIDDTYGTDNANYSLEYITEFWQDFPAGTDDRENDEENASQTGRNAWDYEYYNSGAYTEIYLNCLDGQDP